MPQSYTKEYGSRKVPDSSKYLYNIDTFWYNCNASNYQYVMDDGFRDLLVSARDYFIDTGESKTIEVSLQGYENPLIFELKSGQPPLYQYSIRNEDIAIYFSKNVRNDAQLPMKVQINQFILWEKGIIDAVNETLRVLMALGFEPTDSRLNRVDFAIHSDQFQWTLDDLKTFDYPRNFANDNKPNFYRLCPVNGDFETVYYGDRSRLQLRIYNKSKEVQKKNKTYFTAMYERLGMDPNNVWNVEFECRRDFIKQCVDESGIKLFDDIKTVLEENRLSLLWSHLMEMYSHKSAFWTQLKKGKNGIFEDCKGYLDRVKDIDSSLDREVAQIYGRLKKFVITDDDYSLANAINKFYERAQQYEIKKDTTFFTEVEKKKKEYHTYDINSKIDKKNASAETDTN